jgi:hypothetical protein
MGNVYECVLDSYMQHLTLVLTSLGSMVFGLLDTLVSVGRVVGKAWGKAWVGMQVHILVRT